ncbi:hypothetical protein SISSUDRAFT_1057612 [Sistotremastrum suecicum HHB10207 ss-3]|uniref:Ribonuclease H2 subunit B n=1 Tax=Sistotremastrum suecicum HHB10207 ss-3 TaxID=1314776 RepID=A0A166ICC5_9AGAM|nr:hypothetical protein SISSUDRAFT_1057612 [Sistotremastrum suecicum HHB10207 ss-3]
MSTNVCLLPQEVLLSISENTGSSTRFLQLPHPRTGLWSLFLSHPESESSGSPKNSFLEVQSISPTNTRSWFLENHVVEDGKLLMFTPVDPAFLLAPLLQVSQPTRFQPVDDVLENTLNQVIESMEFLGSAQRKRVLREDVGAFLQLECTKKALFRISDTQEINSDLHVVRFSETKWLEVLAAKIARLARPEVAGNFKTITRSLARDGLLSEEHASLTELGRIKCACDMVSQYLSADMASTLLSRYDLSSLTQHLDKLDQESVMKVEVEKKKTTGNAKETKKRKANRQASKGVEKLMKANTTGMAKLSSFFKKAS